MLDVPSASKNNSVSMKLWQPNGDNNQLWEINDLGNGYYSIINKNSNGILKLLIKLFTILSITTLLTLY